MAATTMKVQFVCSGCGHVSSKWAGRCPACEAWDTLSEEVVRPQVVGARGRGPARASAAQPASLASLVAVDVPRVPTGIAEFDRVLGGGLVRGSVVLLSGDPGIGKSTLALQIASRCGSAHAGALYCAGEESGPQVALRARRIGCGEAAIEVLGETDIDILIATIEASRPALAIIDSIQTAFDSAIPGAPGSVSQVREGVQRLAQCAKSTNVPILLIGHVTKEGAIAGPRTLEHMVDVVLFLEGERNGDHRILRGFKNRYGTTDEVGLFVMSETGMGAAADGRAFLDDSTLEQSGNVLTITCEGSRPIAVEVQALVVASPFTIPRRTVSGFDLGRLNLLLAVLEKRCGLGFSKHDVYLNVVGGLRLVEPAADLAILLALAGSRLNKILPSGAVAVGEVGLGGEVRRVRRLEQRCSEANTLGMNLVVVPAGAAVRDPGQVRVTPVGTVGDAVRLLTSS